MTSRSAIPPIADGAPPGILSPTNLGGIMMRVVAGLLCASLAVFCSPQAQAQTYPTKPIRIIVPYAPGGFADVAARIVAQKLQERLGQQVIVENRSGGNGFIGTTAGAKAAPDGYTLLTAHTGEFAVSPAVFKDIPFELERDFESITMISTAPLLVAANAKGSNGNSLGIICPMMANRKLIFGPGG